MFRSSLRHHRVPRPRQWLALFTLAALLAPGSAAVDIEPDSQPLPAPLREVESPSGRFVLVLSTPDAWKSRRVHAEFFRVEVDARTPLWKRALPQELGPRHVLVDDRGRVLLLDEWIHVKSDRAAVVLDRNGRQVARHSFDDIQKVVDVPARDLVRRAKLGWWITKPPRLDPNLGVASIATGGKLLLVHLADGQLSLAQ